MSANTCLVLEVGLVFCDIQVHELEKMQRLAQDGETTFFVEVLDRRIKVKDILVCYGVQQAGGNHSEPR